MPHPFSLPKLVEIHGIDNVEITVPLRPVRLAGFITYTSSGDEPDMVPCRIVEDRYKVADKYKVTLVPKLEGYAPEHFYQMDLEPMLADGSATIRILTEDGAKR